MPSIWIVRFPHRRLRYLPHHVFSLAFPLFFLHFSRVGDFRSVLVLIVVIWEADNPPPSSSFLPHFVVFGLSNPPTQAQLRVRTLPSPLASKVIFLWINLFFNACLPLPSRLLKPTEHHHRLSLSEVTISRVRTEAHERKPLFESDRANIDR